MLLSCIYLTRKCPMNCAYCSIRDNKLQRSELSLEEWKKAFLNLKSLGVEFHLILGNEALALGKDFVELVKFWGEHNISYAVYSTCPEPLFSELKQDLLDAGLKNLSFGFDTFYGDDSIGVKSRRGFEKVSEMKKMGLPDFQGTITLSNRNINEVEELLSKLTAEGIWGAVNSIHWNKDGKYDFFPVKEKIKEFILEDKKDEVKLVMDRIKEKTISGEYKIQNPPEYFDDFSKYAYNMGWHCKTPKIITVDSDGSLRVCAYRKGDTCSNHNVLNLNSESLKEYQKSWSEDSKQCPGCFWSYWWMAEWSTEQNKEEFGKKMFQDHASQFYKEK